MNTYLGLIFKDGEIYDKCKIQMKKYDSAILQMKDLIRWLNTNNPNKYQGYVLPYNFTNYKNVKSILHMY